MYEPPTVPSGGDLELYDIGPGVRGYAVMYGDRIFIPLIESTRHGSVGPWLATLSSRCVIANVVSLRLASMLERRGWHMTEELVSGAPLDVWSHA